MAQINIPSKNLEQDPKTLLRAIFDQRYQLAGVLSPEGILIDANQRALDFAGIELKDVVGRPFWETPWWSHSIDLQKRIRNAVNQASQGETISFETKIYCANESAATISFSVRPVFNDVGQICCLVPEGIDITNQKNTEQEYIKKKKEEENLWGILENSLNEIYIFDPESLLILHANKGTRRNLGYSMEELNNITPFDIKPEYTREKFQQLVDPLRQGTKKKIEFITTHQRKDGSTYPVEIHLQLMNFPDFPVFVSIILDITHRKNAERELRESEERFRKIFDHAALGITIMDWNGKFEHCNPAFCKLLGYKENELRKRTSASLVHPDDLEANLQELERLRERELPFFEIENRYLHKNGTPVWVHKFFSILHDKDDHPSYLVALISDITERKKAEEALRQSHDLLEQRVKDRTEELEITKEESERANTLKSKFLTAASHDLRQPLQSLGMYISILSKKNQTPKNQEIFEKIDRAFDNVNNILAALLDISKLESDSVTPVKRDFPLQELFEQIKTDIAPYAQKKGLELNISTTNSVVHTDFTLLQRIVENFVSNAVCYTDNGNIEVGCQNNQGYAQIHVKDTGIGIPRESIDKIFEEYYQIDNPARNHAKGLGLGLSIVKHISNLLNHKIEVISESNIGSTFTVYVPLTENSLQQIQVRDNVRTVNTKDITVLLIDDDELVSDAISMLLDIEGFQVQVAMNGNEAIELLNENQQPNIIISDYRLPGKNGKDVVQNIRDKMNQIVPAIILTGDTSVHEIESTNLTNCTILHKPADMQKLLNVINEMTT